MKATCQGERPKASEWMARDFNADKEGFSRRDATSNSSKIMLGQARKSARGMPWHWEPTKGVAIYEKPRGAESRP